MTAHSTFAMLHVVYDLETEPMVGAVRQNSPMLSVASFRAWLGSRPDEEHWELIEGMPMMMAPPNRRHQRIASNLENLLNDALRGRNPTLVAYQAIGVNVVSTVPYDPEPDIAVIREEENSDPPIDFTWWRRFCRTATRISSRASGIFIGLTPPVRAFCWCVRTAWRSRWSIGPRTVGVRRSSVPVMSSRYPNSA